MHNVSVKTKAIFIIIEWETQNKKCFCKKKQKKPWYLLNEFESKWIPYKILVKF